jgi:hypothetical protein
VHCQAEKRKNLLTGYNQLVAGGDKNVHYVTADKLFVFNSTVANDTKHIISPTVGGCHPTDLGQTAMASFYTTFIQALLSTVPESEGTSAHPHLSLKSSGSQDLIGLTERCATLAEQRAHDAEVARLHHETFGPAETLESVTFTDIESSPETL